MRTRTRPLSTGPFARRHRLSRRGLSLAPEWLEVRRVLSVVVAPPASSAPDVLNITNNGPVPAGTPLTVTITAQEPGGGPLTYLFDFFDDGHFEATNSTGVASETYDTPGRKIIHLEVVDDQGDRVDFLTIADVTPGAPAVTSPGDQAATEGTTSSFDLGQFDQLGGAGPWNVTVDWGDGRAPSTFSAATPGDLGTLPHDFAKFGTDPVTVSVSDGQLTGSATFHVAVADVVPAVTSPGDQSATEGSSSSFDLGQLIDPGADAPWRVTVDWGDGTAPSMFSVTTTGDLGALPHDFAKFGTYPVTVTVSDGQKTGTATFDADVADVAPSVAAAGEELATEGTTFAFALGQFTDPGADGSWLVTVDWGDHSTPSTFSVSSTGDLGTALHDYARYGTYLVTVDVKDGASTGSTTFLAGIVDVPPLVTPAAGQTVAPGVATSVALGRFADPGADAPWLVTVDWGDHTAAASFSVNAAGDLGAMTHEFTIGGTYVVTVTVNDGELTDSATFLADVGPTPSPPPPAIQSTEFPSVVPPPSLPAALGPSNLLADFTVFSFGLAVGPANQAGPLGGPGGFQLAQVIQSALRSGNAGVIFVIFAAPEANGDSVAAVAAAVAAAEGAAAGGANAGAAGAGPVVVEVVVAAPNPVPAPAPTPSTTTTTTTAPAAVAVAAPASPPPAIILDEPGTGGAMTTIVFVVAFVGFQHQDRNRFAFGFSRRRHRG